MSRFGNDFNLVGQHYFFTFYGPFLPFQKDERPWPSTVIYMANAPDNFKLACSAKPLSET